MMTQPPSERQTSGRDRIAAVRALAPIFWAALAFGLARSAMVLGVFPVLGVWRGPLGAALLAAGIALAVGRRVRPRLGAPPRTRTLWAAAAVVYLSLGLYYASRLRVSGDEPHYLLMAQSLWREGDL